MGFHPKRVFVLSPAFSRVFPFSVHFDARRLLIFPELQVGNGRMRCLGLCQRPLLPSRTPQAGSFFHTRKSSMGRRSGLFHLSFCFSPPLPFRIKECVFRYFLCYRHRPLKTKRVLFRSSLLPTSPGFDSIPGVCTRFPRRPTAFFIAYREEGLWR